MWAIRKVEQAKRPFGNTQHDLSKDRTQKPSMSKTIGRCVEIHVIILQWLYNLSDEQMEFLLNGRFNPSLLKKLFFKIIFFQKEMY